MQQRSDYHTASAPPLRAEPRSMPLHGGTGHIEGVDATPGGLIRSTIGAGVAALAILTFFYLPAEYGIDPTGVGGLLGLNEMGEIKQQLYADAAAEDAALTAQAAPLHPTGSGDLVARLDRIDAQLAAIAAIIGADRLTLTTAPTPAVQAAPTPAVPAEPSFAVPTEPSRAAEPSPVVEAIATPQWRDEVSYAIAPGDGIEVKLVMESGQTARFEWTANGSILNYDTHGDGGGNKISYERGRGIADQAGELTAAFSGNHGWFWRNRTEEPVTVTLRIAGDYAAIKVP